MTKTSDDKQPKLKQQLAEAINRLQASGSSSARLDAEVLLARTMSLGRAQLLTRLEDLVDTNTLAKYERLIARREKSEPIAYILGRQEFYGLEFRVNQHTLVPRPESEALVDYIVANAPQNASVLDVGTGSGAIALAIKHEREDLKVSGVDISSEALTVATQNAKTLGLQVELYKSDLLTNVQVPSDYIVANLPYLAPQDMNQIELSYEPKQALLADKKDGNSCYLELFRQIQKRDPMPALLIEHLPRQLQALSAAVKDYDWTVASLSDFCTIIKT